MNGSKRNHRNGIEGFMSINPVHVCIRARFKLFDDAVYYDCCLENIGQKPKPVSNKCCLQTLATYWP